MGTERLGAVAPYSGIYRCEGCGLNEVFAKDQLLTVPSDHQHAAHQGAVRWRLVSSAVWANVK